MPLIPFSVPPGVYRNGTRYQSQGRFYDADLWRWVNNTSQPVGGWRLKTSETVDGVARGIYSWSTNNNQSFAAIGTNEGLFSVSRAGAVANITPAGFTPKPPNASTGGGYGRGPYGRGTYGTPRPDILDTIPVSVWSLDNWGENLVSTIAGPIYEWSPNTPAALVVNNAPSAEAVMVTEERSMMAIGAGGDPRAVDWSDLEDNTDWTPTATNQAGGRRLQTSGKLLTGKRIRGGALIFGDADVHLCTYAGLPIVYSFERLATDCGLISKGAPICVDDRAWWMGKNGFWSYDGFVKPLSCDVQDYIFGNINMGQASKVSGVHLSEFGEVWWFYPSAASVECDSYVTYNYRENHWSIGKIARTCGVPRVPFEYPLMVSPSGQIFEHEVADFRDGRRPFCLSGPIEIGNGDRCMNVSEIIPDETNLGDVDVSFMNGDWPMSPDEVVASVPSMDHTDVRFENRRVAVRMTAAADIDFRVGDFRFNVIEGSHR